MASYARIGIYSITDHSYDELIERARDGMAPILCASPGFISYSMTDLGDGRFVSTSAWETREQGEVAGVKSADWVSENISDAVLLQENLIGELTTLEDRQLERQSVGELVGELGRRGARALHGLNQRKSSPPSPLETAATDGVATLADDDAGREQAGSPGTTEPELDCDATARQVGGAGGHAGSLEA
jgi:hypothetical protein